MLSAVIVMALALGVNTLGNTPTALADGPHWGSPNVQCLQGPPQWQWHWTYPAIRFVEHRWQWTNWEWALVPTRVCVTVQIVYLPVRVYPYGYSPYQQPQYVYQPNQCYAYGVNAYGCNVVYGNCGAPSWIDPTTKMLMVCGHSVASPGYGYF